MNDRAVIALACQIVRLRDRMIVWKQTAKSYDAERDQAKHEAVSARADAVTRAEADRVRMEALSEDLRKEREAHDGLLTQVQDMRAEIERLRDENRIMKQDDDGYANAIKVLGDPIQLAKERDALRAEVAELKTQLERLKSPTSKHPVKVGEWVRRTTAGSVAPIGTAGSVMVVWSDAYQVQLRKGFSTLWSFGDCTPCDPPTEATHDTTEGRSVAESVIRDDRKTEPKPGDMVRLVRVPTEATVGDTLRKALEWPWEQCWGSVGDLGQVIESTGSIPGARSVRILSSGMRAWWPLSCVEVVRTEPDEIKVGDVVEVFQATAKCTLKTDIGTRGTVLQLDDSCVYTAPLDGFLAPTGNHVALCDVRTVTT